MDKNTNSLVDSVDKILNLKVGDPIRLEYIKKTLLDNKTLYASDQNYLENLINKYLRNDLIINSNETNKIKSNLICWGCQTPVPGNSRYCPSCGVKQLDPHSTGILKPSSESGNPIGIITNLSSYQILAVLGGLAALIPILAILSEIDNILIEIFGEISEIGLVLIAGGIISCILSASVIVLPFLIKHPRKLGRILFFASFAILITSVLIGIIGFILILVASVLAFKKRRY